MNYYTYIHVGVPAKNVSYGDFTSTEETPTKTNKKFLYLVPDLMAGGDYSNSGTYSISNHRVFLKKYGKYAGVHKLTSGWGTFAVAIRLDVLDRHPEIHDCLDSLNRYPIIDDQDLSDLETEKSEEAWKEWAKDDLVRELRKSDPSLENFEPGNKLEHLFYAASQESEEYWESQAGGSMYINIDKIVPYVRDRLLLDRIELPLLIGHTWVSKDALKEFETRLRGGKECDDVPRYTQS